MSAVGPPHVLFVTKGLDIGGIERMVVDLAVAMAGRGVAVDVAVVNERRSELIGPLAEAGITVHRLGGSDRIGWSAARRLARLAASPRFDVVHVHGPLPALPVRLVRDRPVVVTTSHTPLTALRWPTRVAWQLTAGRDAASVAVSPGVASSMPRRLERRVVVIPHGIDPDVAAAASLGVASRGRPRWVTAVTVASHRGPKNYPNLLRAISVARSLGAPLRLVAVGTGPDLDRHRALAAELGLADVVTFQPPATDVLRIIAGADLLVVSSDYEGQPLVVLEALAVGRPVVATSVGRVRELVTPDVGRVVPIRDSRALGAALAELALDEPLRSRMGKAAQARAGVWTLDDVVASHLALYTRVIADRAARRPRSGTSRSLR